MGLKLEKKMLHKYDIDVIGEKLAEIILKYDPTEKTIHRIKNKYKIIRKKRCKYLHSDI